MSLSSVVSLPESKAYDIWRNFEHPEGDLINFPIRPFQSLVYALRVGVPTDFKY